VTYFTDVSFKREGMKNWTRIARKIKVKPARRATNFALFMPSP
jgi:hypothetical protein